MRLRNKQFVERKCIREPPYSKCARMIYWSKGTSKAVLRDA